MKTKLSSSWSRINKDLKPAPTMCPGLARSLEIEGSQSALARRLKVRPQSVQQWVEIGYPPFRRVLQLIQLYDIPFKDLIPPDVWKQLKKEGKL